MDTSADAHAETLSVAHLLIHAEDGVDSSGRRIEAALRRLRSLYVTKSVHEDRVQLRVQINDLQGQRVFDIEAVAGPLIDVPLPAGTYHVTAHLGKVRRGYTMTLKQGSSFDLYLRLAVHR